MLVSSFHHLLVLWFCLRPMRRRSTIIRRNDELIKFHLSIYNRTIMTETKSAERKPRTFTTPETLATHPIIALFNRPDIRMIMKVHGETGLRFAEIQYLLCKKS